LEQHTYKHKVPFELESGEQIPRYELFYQTWGTLNENKDNVIWICHALTASSDAIDWWDGMIGEGKLYDPKKHFIICHNMYGSCYGSTSPLSTNPNTQRLYLRDFPQYTTRDSARAVDELRKELGFTKIHSLVGGSMGGMVALEWSILQPTIFENLVLLATCANTSPWGIALNETQRMCIESDTTWYEDHAKAGKNGLRAARAVALLSYRNYEAYKQTQSETDIEKIDHYRAQTYQVYQGEKLVNRFNTHAYYFITKAMDAHHVGRGRGSLEIALKTITSNTVVIGISSDMLFPVEEQIKLAELITNADYHEIDSFYTTFTKNTRYRYEQKRNHNRIIWLRNGRHRCF
jgi:homoserine O-acetyltransferase/O-succinyltransferase